MKITVDDMIAAFEQNHPQLEWLMRQDDERGYFVHLHSPNLGFHDSEGLTFPAYGKTLALAFQEAFSAVDDFYEGRGE